jgi:hypothetical protein
MLPPLPPVEVHVVEPSLIDVEDPLALVEEVEHNQGELLPEDQTLLGVG